MNGSEKLHSYRNVSVLAILTATKPPLCEIEAQNKVPKAGTRRLYEGKGQS